MANKMKAITVEDLHVACGMAIRKGLGKRRIMITNDDEGNGYHELFFSFTMPNFERQGMDCMMPCGVTPEQAEKGYIVLG